MIVPSDTFAQGTSGQTKSTRDVETSTQDVDLETRLAQAQGQTVNDAAPGAPVARTHLDTANLHEADSNFLSRVEGTMVRLQRQGYKPRVASGVRTLREQIALVKSHRSTTLYSAHVWGFGADIIDLRWGWNVPAGQNYWRDLTEAAQAEGLVSGGTWTRFPDVAHVELPGWRSLR